MVRRSGNSSVSCSFGPSCSVIENGDGARPPRSSSHSQPCRNGEPGDPPRDTATAGRPRLRDARSSCRRGAATATATRPTAPAGLVAPRVDTHALGELADDLVIVTARTGRGDGGGTRCRRSDEVTVPSHSAQPTDDGKTTSASWAVAVMKMSCTTRMSRPSSSARLWPADASSRPGSRRCSRRP